MGLTANSTGKKILSNDIETLKGKCDYTIAIAGNPNVGKSTIFNSLTGMKQHTGNWPGKTVENASGICEYSNKKFLLVDIPGTYSILSNSEEEEIARDYICFGNPDATVIILDATVLERNLNLVYQIMEITPNIIVCVNLLDEAKKKGIEIDLQELENKLGVPVVGTIASKKKTLKNLLEKIYQVATKKIIVKPKPILYIPCLEDAIKIIREEVIKILPKDKQYLARWIAIKLIDKDEKILNNIEKNLDINITQNENIQNKVDKANEVLKENSVNEKNLRNTIVSSIIFEAESITKEVTTKISSKNKLRDRKIDKILTSKIWGIPIMLLFLGIILWITIVGANYPSEWLSNFFNFLQDKIVNLFEIMQAPTWLKELLIDGVYKTVTWIISVMLPPMAIFFPLFTLLEDLGVLPRIAFNLDKYFKKACSSGKQALTMCMGLGCNAAGVVGSKIIDSPREKLISMLTNSFMPCNGRFPFLIAIATIFIGAYFTGTCRSLVSTIMVLVIIVLGIIFTLVVSKILSKTILKGEPNSFILELPPYRKPQIGKIIVRSIFDRTLFVLGRAITVAVPAGIIIWIFANIQIGDLSILSYIANFLDPFAKLMGLDGYILTAFILGLPANEIVLPIILMSYLGKGSLVNIEETAQIGNILLQNGWTLLTAINVMIFTVFHFPCGTTLLTIKKESGKWKWALLAFAVPTICGIALCMLTTLIWNLF